MLRLPPTSKLSRRWATRAALPLSLLLLSACTPRQTPTAESSPVTVSPSPVAVPSPAASPTPAAVASPKAVPSNLPRSAAAAQPAPKPRASVARAPRVIDSSRLSIATRPTSGVKLEQSHAEVGGIRLGAPEAEVRRIMGEPARERDEQTGCCGTLRSLTYNDLTISLIQGEMPNSFSVYSLASRNPGYATADGIRIGSSREQVTAAYGAPSRESTEGGLTHIVYDVGEAASFLTFGLQGDRVVEIGYDSLLN